MTEVFAQPRHTRVPMTCGDSSDHLGVGSRFFERLVLGGVGLISFSHNRGCNRLPRPRQTLWTGRPSLKSCNSMGTGSCALECHGKPPHAMSMRTHGDLAALSNLVQCHSVLNCTSSHRSTDDRGLSQLPFTAAFGEDDRRLADGEQPAHLVMARRIAPWIPETPR